MGKVRGRWSEKQTDEKVLSVLSNGSWSKKQWSKKQTDEKVLSVLSNIWSISIIIFVCTQILGVWKIETDVFVPLLGVSMLIQAIQYSKKNKEVAQGHLLVAILALVFSIFEFIIK
ncbi:hypothetical protein [Clostridium estertheticum]|uniref:hypothetical protein n=1 Tax=Clostridium estertheticum TaxID=238834 RepID=UPI000B2C755B|nr:hypothetical protein [Clostridium estertheticum]MBZ9614764.1 hypothetical protein [Clostridium estertheticum subsp. laramiense]MCB2339034.1 hypothetical protein [Clostridium estertheticum]WAG74681.1 hypothetical protein LL032_04270 [Clostridium estertheticum]